MPAVYTSDTMPEERLAFLRAVNARPRDRTLQLVFADWLQEHGEYQFERFMRGGRGGLGGRGGRGGLGGRGGRGGLGGLGGLGGRGGLGGLGGLLSPEGRIVLVFMPHGYGFAVFVGTVATETPHGWIVDPARTIEQVNPDDANDARWVELAAGSPKTLRKNCRYGVPIEGGVRVPLGVMSLLWHGALPE